MYVKLNGEMVHLWRAMDHEGEALESYVSRTRGKPTILAPGAGTFLRFATQRDRPQDQASGIARVRWLAPWFGFAVMALIAIVD